MVIALVDCAIKCESVRSDSLKDEHYFAINIATESLEAVRNIVIFADFACPLAAFKLPRGMRRCLVHGKERNSFDVFG